MVHYVSGKMARVASVRDGGSASVKLCEAFGTYKNFREFRDNQEARQLFLSTCSPAEVQAAAFIKTAMEGNIVTHDILQNSLKANWLQPAELIMQNPSWVEKEIFDLDELLKQDPLVPVQTEVNQSDTAAALATKPEAKEDEAESVPNAPLKDEIPEVTTDAAGPVEQTRSRASFFSVATIPAWAEDLFQKVTLATFQQSLEHARACRVLIGPYSSEHVKRRFLLPGLFGMLLLGHLISEKVLTAGGFAQVLHQAGAARPFAKSAMAPEKKTAKTAMKKPAASMKKAKSRADNFKPMTMTPFSLGDFIQQMLATLRMTVSVSPPPVRMATTHSGRPSFIGA